MATEVAIFAAMFAIVIANLTLFLRHDERRPHRTVPRAPRPPDAPCGALESGKCLLHTCRDGCFLKTSKLP